MRGTSTSILSTFSQVGSIKTQNEVSLSTIDRQLKRVQSSPGLVTDAGNRSPNRNSSPFSANSISTGGSSVSLSRNTSFLPTPVSSHSVNPYIEGGDDGSMRHHRYGTDGVLTSPTGVPQLRHYKSSTFSLVEKPAPEDDDDAKLAIMGDGGCFPTDEDKMDVQDGKTLSEFPSLASLRSDPSVTLNQDDDDLILDPLQSLEIDSDEENDFDTLAVEEMEMFDGRTGDPALGSFWSSSYEDLCRRVYVRPRKAFAGLGMHVPAQLLELDDLSMGVHLTRAWLNVVACKEAMWDELQRRAQLVQSPTQECSIEPTSPPMQRVTLLDDVEWLGTEKRMSDREKFELLFLRFEDDMRQWAAVGSSIPRKLTWVDPRYPNFGPVPALSSKRSTLRTSSIPHGSFSLDDGCGPGRDGIVVPGIDVCRTIRVFTGRKVVDNPPGCSSSKIFGLL